MRTTLGSISMNTKNFDWHTHLLGCMQSTNYCCLATVDKTGVWSNPVYFAWDDSFAFYFISQMKSRHMQNIQNNSAVSLSIYTTEQKENIRGIQLEGRATILNDQKAINQAYKVYYGRLGKDQQAYYENDTWTIVQIKPEKMYYFDDRFFEEERQLVPQHIYFVGN